MKYILIIFTVAFITDAYFIQKEAKQNNELIMLLIRNNELRGLQIELLQLQNDRLTKQ